MELVIAAVLVVLVPLADKLIKILQDRSRTRGETEVIHAHALADLARARGEAELIRAEAALPPARRKTAAQKGSGRA
ncbi:hypothetical protein GCM10010363_60700 [Streptomyces omiyaensis]|uniref:hypothetical protein n=1 Tax=Streptomyces omiyaensis TaxID=68247 RepID=UPI00167A0E38|nr:hypothetical protein [Streptomyces omiyaensis]GGY71302.1 hypothetical protein GCM10010363_60700 [Streptomyces omiyaensis]